MARRAPAGIGTGSPVRAKQIGLLIPTLLIIVVAAVLIPASWWALLAVLIILLVAPWILLCAIERRTHD